MHLDASNPNINAIIGQCKTQTTKILSSLQNLFQATITKLVCDFIPEYCFTEKADFVNLSSVKTVQIGEIIQ